jgi:hypothetical protein
VERRKKKKYANTRYIRALFLLIITLNFSADCNPENKSNNISEAYTTFAFLFMLYKFMQNIDSNITENTNSIHSVVFEESKSMLRKTLPDLNELIPVFPNIEKYSFSDCLDIKKETDFFQSRGNCNIKGVRGEKILNLDLDLKIYYNETQRQKSLNIGKLDLEIDTINFCRYNIGFGNCREVKEKFDLLSFKISAEFRYEKEKISDKEIKFNTQYLSIYINFSQKPKDKKTKSAIIQNIVVKNFNYEQEEQAKDTILKISLTGDFFINFSEDLSQSRMCFLKIGKIETQESVRFDNQDLKKNKENPFQVCPKIGKISIKWEPTKKESQIDFFKEKCYEIIPEVEEGLKVGLCSYP